MSTKKPKATPSPSPQNVDAYHWYYENRSGIELYDNHGRYLKIPKRMLVETMPRITGAPLPVDRRVAAALAKFRRVVDDHIDTPCLLYSAAKEMFAKLDRKRGRGRK